MATTYYATDTRPTIAPREGSYYTTRDGANIGPMRHDTERSEAFPWFPEKFMHPYAISGWADDGSFARAGADGRDIVAEGTENVPKDTRPTIAPAAGKRYLMRNGEGVGPMRFRDDTACPWLGYVGTGVARTYTAQGAHHTDPQYDIVAEVTDTPTAEGPVRRLTKIVPGNYNKVVVEYAQNTRELRVYTNLFQPATATELRAAAATLSALAEALDEMGGAS